jgi:hypothetical protein
MAQLKALNVWIWHCPKCKKEFRTPYFKRCPFDKTKLKEGEVRKQKDYMTDFCDWCEKEIAVSAEGDFANLTPVILGNNQYHFHLNCWEEIKPFIKVKTTTAEKLAKFSELWGKISPHIDLTKI